MKKLFSILFVLAISFASAQSLNFGVKGGLAYKVNKGDGVLNTASTAWKAKGDGSAGFQAGFFLKAKLTSIFIQPELLYSNFKDKYSDNGQDLKVTKQRLDIPVNVGKDFIGGLLHLQLGPVFSYYFEDKISANELKQSSQDDFNLGFQLGGGITIKKIVLDVKYEFGLGKQASSFVNKDLGYSFNTENRANLLLATVGYIF